MFITHFHNEATGRTTKVHFDTKEVQTTETASLRARKVLAEVLKGQDHEWVIVKTEEMSLEDFYAMHKRPDFVEKTDDDEEDVAVVAEAADEDE
jgi:hypothetical protein